MTQIHALNTKANCQQLWPGGRLKWEGGTKYFGELSGRKTFESSQGNHEKLFGYCT